MNFDERDQTDIFELIPDPSPLREPNDIVEENRPMKISADANRKSKKNVRGDLEMEDEKVEQGSYKEVEDMMMTLYLDSRIFFKLENESKKSIYVEQELYATLKVISAETNIDLRPLINTILKKGLEGYGIQYKKK